MNEHNIKVHKSVIKNKSIKRIVRMVCHQAQMGQYNGVVELKIPLNKMLSDIISLD